MYTELDAEADPLALPELEADPELDAGPELDAAGAVIFISCAPSLQVVISLTRRGHRWSRRDYTSSARARARARRPSGRGHRAGGGCGHATAVVCSGREVTELNHIHHV